MPHRLKNTRPVKRIRYQISVRRGKPSDLNQFSDWGTRTVEKLSVQDETKRTWKSEMWEEGKGREGEGEREGRRDGERGRELSLGESIHCWDSANSLAFSSVPSIADALACRCPPVLGLNTHFPNTTRPHFPPSLIMRRGYAGLSVQAFHSAVRRISEALLAAAAWETRRPSRDVEVRDRCRGIIFHPRDERNGVWKFGPIFFFLERWKVKFKAFIASCRNPQRLFIETLALPCCYYSTSTSWMQTWNEFNKKIFFYNMSRNIRKWGRFDIKSLPKCFYPGESYKGC